VVHGLIKLDVMNKILNTLDYFATKKFLNGMEIVFLSSDYKVTLF